MAAKTIRIRKGLDLPITGRPPQHIEPGPPIRRFAVIGPDAVGMKPTMAVREGDEVELGQPLFTDKSSPGVAFTAPAAGRVASIRRGEKRAFLAVEIEPHGHDAGGHDATGRGAAAGGAGGAFAGFAAKSVREIGEQRVREGLLASGLWTALRTRPFSRIPASDAPAPRAIFVTAMDSNPLAVDPDVVVAERRAEFEAGLWAVSQLTHGRVYLCRRAGSGIGRGTCPAVFEAEFDGPHPSGLVGTHIHFLDPVGPKKTVWTVGYQDVIAFGHLFLHGRLSTERVVSIAGPGIIEPIIVRTRLGASIDDLVRGRLRPGEQRVISGSVLSGRTAVGPFAYLGRYHQQVSVLPEGRTRRFLGWMLPGADRFSIKNVYLSKLVPGKLFAFDTGLEGSPRAMVPIGSFEKVMPLDIPATYFLRSLLVGDTDQAQALGCLELDEEDVGLLSYVCPGKTDYAPILRNVLTQIEKDG